MINLIADRIGPYVGVEPQAFSASDVTGSYYLMGKKNTYTLMVNDLEAGEIAKLDILQATDVDGTGAKAITDQDDTATATGTITGRARAQKLSVLVDSVTNGKTIILVCSQGGSAVTYTKAAATDATAQEFLNAAGLVLCINTDQSEYVTASASGTTVTIILAHPEKGGHMTESGDQETAKLITTSQASMLRISVECDAPESVDDFVYLAPKVTCDGAADCSVLYEREGRKCPDSGNCAYDVRIK